MYRVYRVDVDSGDKRSVDEISQQELKKAVCITLQKKGALDKDSLVKETIRTMGCLLPHEKPQAAAMMGSSDRSRLSARRNLPDG